MHSHIHKTYLGNAIAIILSEKNFITNGRISYNTMKNMSVFFF